MDKMRIRALNPVILSKKEYKKLNSDAKNAKKQADAKRDGVINPQDYNFNQY